MLIDSNIKIFQGSDSLLRVYQGSTVVWEPVSETTVLHYRGYYGKLELDTGSTWYSSIKSHTYENGLGTIVFNGVQTTFYKLFNLPRYLTYLEIPESITVIDSGALRNIGDNAYWHGGCELVAFPHTAPAISRDEWYDSEYSYFSSFSYPDDADYISWYFPNYFSGNTEYNFDASMFSRLKGDMIAPQLIWVDSIVYDTGPSVQIGWDGNYLGRIVVTDPDDIYDAIFYAFSRKIVNVPEGAFIGWPSYQGQASRIVFPDCTRTIGNRAFYNAKLTKMPRFRGAQTFGNGALNFASAVTIDLPSGVTTIDPYFNTGTTRINAYGPQPSFTGGAYVKSTGYFAYNNKYAQGGWISRLPQNWTKQGINPDSWPDLPDMSIYLRATSNNLHIVVSLDDSTESWENGIFYISGGSYTAKTEICRVTYYDERKTVDVAVENGASYIISYTPDSARGCHIEELTGADTLYVNQYPYLFYDEARNRDTILMTKHSYGDTFWGAFYYNNDYRFGY